MIVMLYQGANHTMQTSLLGVSIMEQIRWKNYKRGRQPCTSLALFTEDKYQVNEDGWMYKNVVTKLG
jgi:hypothetical protein